MPAALKALPQNRLDQISPILLGLARRYAGPDCDDCFQDMTEKVLSLAPTYTNSYLIQAGRHVAQHWQRDSSRHEQIDEKLATDLFYLELSDLRPSEEESERRVLSERVTEIVGSFSPRQKEIASLLMQGYKKTEIAHELGISGPAVSLYLKAIKSRLAYLKD